MDENGLPKVYGEVCIRRQQRRRRRKLLILELLIDYAKNSTLHGLRYIADTYSNVEKVFWLITFIISLTMCSLLISFVYTKWKTSPVIVSFNEKIASVGTVPFPSVTICPQIKSLPSKYNFSKEFKSCSQLLNDTSNSAESCGQDRIDRICDISIICNQMNKLFFLNNVSKHNYTNSSLVRNIMEVSPDFEMTVWICKWRGEWIDCGDLFKPVLTKEGLCYNFNALAADEIFREYNIQKEYKYLNTSQPSTNYSTYKGYTDYIEEVTYPRRGRENGADPDLEVLLREVSTQRDGLCNGFNKGFKIYVQNPSDMPQSSHYYYAALPRQLTSLALKFSMLTTADSLMNYSPDIRQCYFPIDRRLRYFNIYTQNNCRLECQSNHTFNRCGCVWFHMPHEDSEHICTAHKYECVRRAIDELAIQEITEDLGACRCYPDCYSIYYDAEILKTDYDFEGYIKAIDKLYNFDDDESSDEQFSKIEMYFKEPRYVSMRRSELFGLTDFIANCGGILGLFLGFSFLSLVEILYFVTLRLYYSLKRDLKSEKSDRKVAREKIAKTN